MKRQIKLTGLSQDERKELLNQPIVFSETDKKKLEESLGMTVQKAFEILNKNITQKPEEFEKAFASARYNLQGKNRYLPREYKEFLNWWLYEKHGNLGPGQAFAKRIEDRDFVEFSKFKEELAEGEREKPFWFEDIDNDFWIPKSVDKPNEKTQKDKGEDLEPDIAIDFIDGPRGKLVLLHELGILKTLREEYTYLTKAQFGALLALLTGAKEGHHKQMSKEVDNVLYNTPLPGKSGTAVNRDSVKEVKTALEKVGVKLKRLPENL